MHNVLDLFSLFSLILQEPSYSKKHRGNPSVNITL